MEYFLGQLYPEKPPYNISPRAAERMLAYHWPGNVRELRNVLERAIILSENRLITVQCLPQDIAKNSEGTENGSPFPTIAQSEKRLILRALDHLDGNRTLAARMLGIGRKTLYRKLLEYGIPG
uniref:helix-turn-helix domain-containing protein n=1 Tax=Humidesulfovibrio mexicanus TaxID=147047 RepID=UPI001F29E8E2|nr:helix-turn-helix domain-containing protein [Humidesulfovibrio mexicanus]